MTISIHERELLRTRWRRSLFEVGLDSAAREDFALGGLATRLTDVTVQILLLPADPVADAFPINTTTAQWLSDMNSIQLAGVQLKLPDEARRTAHALVLARQYNNDSWNSYLAIHRSGAIDWGLGRDGGWTRNDREGAPARQVFLSPVVARVWATVRLASILAAEHDVGGPYSLSVGIRGTHGAQLGCLSEGWMEPGDFRDHVRPCVDRHLLWRMEFDHVANEVEAEQIAYGIGDRIEDAWGVSQRRYLANRGDYEGKLDPRTC